MKDSKPFKKTRIITIKNFDKELYRIVKAIAVLEGRTITSIFEEAVRQWLENRIDFEEVNLWIKLEEAYKENLKVLEEHSSGLRKYSRGYALICDSCFIGVFDSYEESIRKSKAICKTHALIISLPYERERHTIDLGLSW